MSFATVALGEVAEINPSAPKLAPNDEVSFLPMADAQNDGTVAISEFRSYREVRTGYTGFANDDVLIAKVTPCFENNKIVQASLPTAFGFGSTEFHVARAGEDLDARYLLHFLRQDWVRYAGERRMTGSGGQRRVPRQFLEQLPIAKPPLPEQRRIAAILDQADALRRLRRQSLARLSDLGQAIFFEMFGSGSEDSNIALTPLASAAKLINGDRSSNYPSGEDLVDDGILFLSTRNIVDGGIDFSHRQFITMDKFNSLGGGKLARGDVVITLRGSTGLSAVFDTEYETGFINAQLMIIRCNDRLLPQYLQKYLSLPSTQHRLKKEGSGSAVPQLTGAQMKEFKILVPPIDQQLAFIEAYADLQDHVSNAILGSRQLDYLFASLQHRAFRGEL